MSQPSLSGCRAKIERAKENVHNFDIEVQAFKNLDPYGIVHDSDPQTRDQVLRVRVSQDPPLRWGIVAGEIVHHLRSALDHLVWQLVLLNSGIPGTWTEFPVVRKSDDWDSKKYKADGGRKHKGVSNAAMRIIERLQPYHVQPPNEIEMHPLFIVHHLDIRDKHQLLNVVGCALRAHNFSIGGPGEDVHIEHAVFGGPELISPLKDGAEIHRVRFGESTPNVSMQGQFSFDVAFEEGGPGKGQPLVPTLYQLTSFVDAAVSLFAPFFR